MMRPHRQSGRAAVLHRKGRDHLQRVQIDHRQAASRRFGTNPRHGNVDHAGLRRQIIDRTDGVPLFVVELTKAVIESGMLTDLGDRYVANDPLPSLAIPATLRASLLARLDRRGPVREMAQIGAALVRKFSCELISAVAADRLCPCRARSSETAIFSPRPAKLLIRLPLGGTAVNLPTARHRLAQRPRSSNTGCGIQRGGLRPCPDTGTTSVLGGRCAKSCTIGRAALNSVMIRRIQRAYVATERKRMYGSVTARRLIVRILGVLAMSFLLNQVSAALAAGPVNVLYAGSLVNLMERRH